MSDAFDEFTKIPPDFDIVEWLSARLQERLNEGEEQSLKDLASSLVWDDPEEN